MDKPTIVLYALSTIAQTCAALAAFVGAVGVFRLQFLEAGRETLYAHIWVTMGNPLDPQNKVLDMARVPAETNPGLHTVLERHAAVGARIRTSFRWLALFETLNLLSVAGALLGFIVLDIFVACPWALGALVALSIAAIVSTGVAVMAWFPRR